jgi:preprotein translocase subunit YajC
MFVSEALAQTPGGGMGGLEGIIGNPVTLMVVLFGVFYFFLIRPQQQKAKKHREVLAALRRGDRVVTAGGMIGTISKVINDRELQVEIAEGVRVRVLRGMVSEVLARTEPADDEDDEGETDKKGDSDKKKVATGR